jgi:hypothetical protein
MFSFFKSKCHAFHMIFFFHSLSLTLLTADINATTSRIVN